MSQSDTIGRLGGEEFAILLEGLTEEQALRLVRRILHEFSEIDHSAPDGSRFHVTASGGVAMIGAPLLDSRSWQEAADTALYEAKRRGRNRVLGASDPPAQARAS